ncbi:MAG: nucleotidyltransferase family protein [Chloroflexota bacterium]
MITREVILRILDQEKPTLRQKYGVERIALFGSFAQGLADENSDIDLVVHLSRPLGFEFVQLGDYLESKLGRGVDLVTYNSLKRGELNPRRAHIARSIAGTLVYV